MKEKTIIKQLLSLCSLLLTVIPLISSATVYTLYDEKQNNLPDDQTWLAYYAKDGSAIPNNITNGVQLVTDTPASAGYSNYSLLPVPGIKNPTFPVLDSSIGFTLSFNMWLHKESHTGNDNRAGFSIILLDSNHQGVELGFWEDSIWSQSANPLFTAKDEEEAFNTTASMLAYDLTLLNNNYYLTHNDIILLEGALKDYSDFNGPLGSLPYLLPNYLFLGDDTSSAAANVTLGHIVLSDTALFTVPSPSTPLLISLGLLSLLRFSSRNSSKAAL